MDKEYSNTILQMIALTMNAHSVVLFKSKTTQNEQVEYHLIDGVSTDNTLDYTAVFTEKDSLLGLLLRQYEPLIIKNYDFYKKKQKLVYYREDAGHNVKSFIALKLKTGYVLCVDSERQYTFGEAEIRLLNLYIELLEDTLDQTAYKENNKRLIAYSNALRQICENKQRFFRWDIFLRELLQILVETTQYRYAVFVVKDKTDSTYFVEGESETLFCTAENPKEYPIQSGAISWVFKNNAILVVEGADPAQSPPLFSKDVEKAFFPSFLCIPVEMHGDARGALCLLHDTNYKVSEELRNFMTTVASYLGIYLENMEIRVQKQKT